MASRQLGELRGRSKRSPSGRRHGPGRRGPARRRQGKPDCDEATAFHGVHFPRGEDRPDGVHPEPRRGPRSRRAVGVGDVAGERGGRPARSRGVKCRRSGRLGRAPCRPRMAPPDRARPGERQPSTEARRRAKGLAEYRGEAWERPCESAQEVRDLGDSICCSVGSSSPPGRQASSSARRIAELFAGFRGGRSFAPATRTHAEASKPPGCRGRRCQPRRTSR